MGAGDVALADGLEDHWQAQLRDGRGDFLYAADGEGCELRQQFVRPTSGGSRTQEIW